MERLVQRAGQLFEQIKQTAARLDLDNQEIELKRLRAEMSSPQFWHDNKLAQAVSKKEAAIARRIEPWLNLRRSAWEMVELADLNVSSMATEIASQLDEIEAKFEELKKELRFQGPYDDHDVILSIYAGAGGTDAQDWAQMLLRMYVRWAESHKLSEKTIDKSAGEEAGI
jgi:peptide chain release factor 2